MGFPLDNIKVRGTRENNLRDVALRIPKRELKACKALNIGDASMADPDFSRNLSTADPAPSH